jgi:hypothetical protein
MNLYKVRISGDTQRHQKNTVWLRQGPHAVETVRVGEVRLYDELDSHSADNEDFCLLGYNCV